MCYSVKRIIEDLFKEIDSIVLLLFSYFFYFFLGGGQNRTPIKL